MSHSRWRRVFAPRLWHLLVPIGILFCVVYVLPFLNIVRMSFEGTEAIAGQYRALIADDIAMLVLWRTIWLSLATAGLCLLFGYPIAYLLHSAPERWQSLLMFLVLLPLWTSVLVRTFAWIVLLGREGMVNKTLIALGITDQPITMLYSRLGTLIGMVQIMLPYMVLPLFAAMANVERRLSQASAVLGAGPFANFVLVFFPLTFHSVMAGFLLVFVISLGTFVTPALLGGVRDTTFVMLIYKNVNELHDWNMAAAMAIVLLIATLVLMLIYRSLLAEKRMTHGTPGRLRGWLFRLAVVFSRLLQDGLGRRRTSGRRSGLASRADSSLRSLKIVGAIFLTLSVLPLLVLVPLSLSDAAFISFPPPAYSLRWFMNFFDRRDWYMPALRSLFIASAVMMLATTVGVCAAIGIARLKRGSSLVFGLILSPLVVPTVVFGLALYLIFAKLGLIGTYLGLILAHTVLAVPYVVVITNSALSNVDGSLENAAQTLGAGPVRAFAKTTLPLIAPTVFTAALFAFLTSFDDIVIALFISDTATTTLPKRMWEGIRFEIDPTSVAGSVVLLAASLLAVGAAELVRHRVRRFRRKEPSATYVG